jgi:hypothetical protein
VRIVNFAELRASAILVLAPGTLHVALRSLGPLKVRTAGRE